MELGGRVPVSRQPDELTLRLLQASGRMVQSGRTAAVTWESNPIFPPPVPEDRRSTSPCWESTLGTDTAKPEGNREPIRNRWPARPWRQGACFVKTATAALGGRGVVVLSVLARNRTWSATFGGSRAIQHTPRTNGNGCEDWRRGVERSWFSTTPRRPPPPHKTAPVSSPGIEPGLRPSQSRVRSSTLQGHALSTPPRIRTSSNGFEDRHASHAPAGFNTLAHPRSAQTLSTPLLFSVEAEVAGPGLEPGRPAL